MEYICDNDFKLSNTCVAFGQFDGMHKGHRSVIEKLVKQESDNLKSVLLSFDYNPTNIFGVNKVLYTEKEKIRLLASCSPDVMISYPFNEQTANMTPEEFIKNVLVDQLGVKVIVAGENCRFGKACSGTFETLREYASTYGYEVACVEAVKNDKEVITSRRVREALEQGDFDKANELFGHTFTMVGEVMHGKALGRTVGMPTANLGVAKNKFIPKHGVYATLSEIDDVMVQGLTNIGKRPSVDDYTYVTIETFLLDFSKDIYGIELALEVHKFIRGVCKFNNLDEVKKQVDLDITSIKKFLGSLNNQVAKSLS